MWVNVRSGILINLFLARPRPVVILDAGLQQPQGAVPRLTGPGPLVLTSLRLAGNLINPNLTGGGGLESPFYIIHEKSPHFATHLIFKNTKL